MRSKRPTTKFDIFIPRLKWVVFYFTEGVVTYRSVDREWHARVTGNSGSGIVLTNKPKLPVGLTGARKVMEMAIKKLVSKKKRLVFR